ncbi:DUF397 domain-containing protein [Streptomyces sp. 35G-GA-8]|uniref:DUF397 domain-containing protein n=1 Tax=Streptomyces sp. 35G-GA-8 TaxID=2939434 RepID=UPI00201F7C11|nr:DUF397 domain-containing protein [Streptomyces sp. 35G-GA-8]MCL7377614.1 DUF397 domain-containing protein [Streptomyces sp. 35G-GA-8]
MTTDESPRWSKSSYSNNGGNCVEVAANLVVSRGVVPIRDSKNLSGPMLNVPAGAFTSFVAGIKAGTLDTA